MTGQPFELWLHDPTGARLALLDTTTGFSYVRAANRVGSWRVNLPGTFPKTALLEDNLVSIWRHREGLTRLEIAGFIGALELYDDSAGTPQISISGPDFNDLLSRYIVAYAAGSSQSAKSDNADDMLKEIIDENMGASATDSARDLSAYLSIQPDTSLGQSIARRFSWDDVLQTCIALADSSTTAGTRIYFDCVPIFDQDSVSVEFRTYANQIGTDRTSSSNKPVIFSREFGNLENAKLVYNWRDGVNVAYVGGQGLGDDREVVEVEDTARSGASIWSRREVFVHATNEQVTSELTARGNEALRKGRPKITASGDLLSVPGSLYGRDWLFGDRVTMSVHGIQVDVNIDAVRVSVTGGGDETVSCRQEVIVA